MKYQGDFLINRILEDMSDGVIVIGFDGTIMLYNSAAERILGMSDDMLRGKSMAEIMRYTTAYAFAGQKNEKLFDIFDTAIVAVTNHRILVVQKKVFFQEVYGIRLLQKVRCFSLPTSGLPIRSPS